MFDVGFRAEEVEESVFARSFDHIDVIFAEALFKEFDFVDMAIFIGASDHIHDGGGVHILESFDHIVFKFGGEASIEPIRSLIDISVMVLRGVCVGDHDERFREGLEALSDEPREGVLFEAFVDAEAVEFVELFLVFSLEGVFYQ